MIKTMFIVPPGGYLAERWSHNELIPALGIGYVAAVLEEEGYKVAILDANAQNLKNEDILTYIKKYNPDLVGLTLTTENRFQAFQTAKFIKSAEPKLKIVLGGPHLWKTADDTLRNLNYIDFVVRGEGELTTLDLVKALDKDKDLNNIPGLSFVNSKGEIIHNPDRKLIENLNEMPFPARHLYPMDRYNYYVEDPAKGKRKALNLMTSRGCPFNCNFCATPSNWGRKVRYLTADKVIEEIELLINQYKVSAIWFFDDTFTFNPKRVEEICDKIIEKKWDLSWYCEIRIDTVNKDLLKKMKEAGCFLIGMGVESASPRILNEIINKGKGFSLDKVTEIIKICLDLDIIPNPFFIISHPTETYQEARQTMDYIAFLRKLSNKIDISLSILHIYPGTPLEIMAKNNNILPKDFSWSLPHQKNIITLPAAQGEIPLYIDKLTWEQISDFLFEWSNYKKYSIINKIPTAIKSIKSWQDLLRYLIMAKSFLKIKYKKIFST